MLEPCRSQIMNQKALTRLDCAVEHPMKDASPACPEPRRREGVSRPKDLHVRVSLLKCAVAQNAKLSALECAVAKLPPRKPFRMRSYKKMWGGGGCPTGSTDTNSVSRFGVRLEQGGKARLCPPTSFAKTTTDPNRL